MKYSGTGKHQELKDHVSGILNKNPNGITHQGLQKSLGIFDPALEENRKKVFQMVSVVANLRKEGFLKSIYEESGQVYFAIGA